MRGNISKSVSLKGDIGKQGIQGLKGDTPNIVFRYDKDTGNLYYSSDGILMSKYDSYDIEAGNSSYIDYTTTALWGSELKALHFTTTKEAPHDGEFSGVRVAVPEEKGYTICHISNREPTDIVEVVKSVIAQSNGNQTYGAVDGVPYTVRIHNHTDEKVTVIIEEFFKKHLD